MADVSRRRLREADRAQLFLIGALALSVIFVVLAVLLNTAIYTGNIATRDPGPGTDEVVEYEHEAATMAETALIRVNDRNNSSYTELESTFGGTIAAWSDAANAHTVADLADAHLSIVTTNRGSTIGQENQNGFVNDTGSGNWTVANDTAARAFRMNVTQSSLVNITGSLDRDDSFYVGFNDSSGEWKAYVYQEGASNVSVDVVHPNGTQVGSTCSVDAGADDHAVIELSKAQVGGQPCPPFTELFRGLSGPYNVTYGNANATGTERINGTYTVVVNRQLTSLETGADENSGEPYAAPALYGADLQVTYRSSVVYYRTNIRVAPEEPDV